MSWRTYEGEKMWSAQTELFGHTTAKVTQAVKLCSSYNIFGTCHLRRTVVRKSVTRLKEGSVRHRAYIHGTLEIRSASNYGQRASMQRDASAQG